MMVFDPISIINKYYDKDSLAYHVLIAHSSMVAKKAKKLAECLSYLQPDVQFLYEASMLHDIGICKIHAEDIGCHGKLPYIQHGILGGEILKKEGLLRHAKVCETHTGVGIFVHDIIKHDLPLPVKNYFPETLEELIVSFADLFYGKDPENLERERTSFEVATYFDKKHGKDKLAIFKSWCELFGINLEYDL